MILATACAAPQSLINPQPRKPPHEGNKPCVIGSKTTSSLTSKTVNIKESPPIEPPVDMDPTNHYYFAAPLDTVINAEPKYNKVPDEVRYNIIFVKVPPFIPKVQEKIELQPKTDEKTTVYVLVKRPEDPKTIKLPKLEELDDEKPEVIVVKYNEDKDIQAEIEGVKQSKIFGDPGIARTSQVSESEVNSRLKKLEKEHITQLKLVDDTRIPSNQQSTRNTAIQSTAQSNSSIKGSPVNEESDEEDEDESIPSKVTQRPARNNLNQETEADQNAELYRESYFEANTLKKIDKTNPQDY